MNRRIFSHIVVLLLAMCLLAAGCATTSSQTATAHKPQMITGEEEHEATLKLPDGIATVLNFVGGLATGFAPESW